MMSRAGNTELRTLTFRRLIAGMVLVGLVTMLPAGTVRFWQAWAYMAALFLPMILFVVYLLQRNPQVLARRMRTQEPEPSQRLIVKLSGFFLFCVLFLPGLDQRWGWSAVCE
jgi:Ca2+/Na+ antiporter